MHGMGWNVAHGWAGHDDPARTACTVRCFGRMPGPQRKEWMARLNPIQFVQEVRQEVAKVTWPTRKEVWITTIAVLIMVSLAAVFFMVADLIIAQIITFILGLGR
jgi:preprotein translocase subunit SecE